MLHALTNMICKIMVDG